MSVTANSHLLAVDIGNSSTVLGLMHAKTGRAKQVWRIPTDSKPLHLWMKKFLRSLDAIPVVVSSVVPHLKKDLQRIVPSLGSELIWLTYDPDSPVRVKLDHPRKVGIDRILNVWAASEKFPDEWLVVIDYGTATTFDVINPKRQFLGGLIAPGPQTMARALHHFCDQLPLIPFRKTKSILGKNTEGAIGSGVYWSVVGQTEKIVETLSQHYHVPLKKVLTGGLGGLVKKSLKGDAKYYPSLTLDGIVLAYQHQLTP